MRELHRRVEGLESKRQPSKLHVVRWYEDQSKEEAIDQYGRDRIGGEDDLIVLIRKPARAA